MKRLITLQNAMNTAAITWEDLQEIGKLAFHVWVDQPELAWARDAWARLSEKCLTQYTGEVEKTEVKFDFWHWLVYITISVTWRGAKRHTMYRLWIAEMEISGVRLGQLLGRDPGVSGEEEDDLYYSAARDLIGRARSEVVAALLEAYGGTSGLLVALWNSLKTHDRADCECVDGCDACKESEDEILNCNIEEKGPVYTWLEQGAEELLEDG